jgi:hypothetical protein
VDGGTTWYGTYALADIPAGLPTGTVTDSVLRWNGSAWVEETSVRVETDGTIIIDGTNEYLRRYNAAWTNATDHTVLYNGYNTSLADYVYLSASGNSSSGHGIIVVADRGFYYGLIDNETGAVPNNDDVNPITDTRFYIDLNGNVTADGGLTLGNSGSTTITLGGNGSGDSNYIDIGKGFDVDSGIRWIRSAITDSRIYVDGSENMRFTLDESNTLSSNKWIWEADGDIVMEMYDDGIIDLESNGNTQTSINIGNKSLYGTASDGVLRLFGENSSTIYGGAISVISSNMQIGGTSYHGGSQISNIQVFTPIQAFENISIQKDGADGDAILKIEADNDNTLESSNPILHLTQDAELVHATFELQETNNLAALTSGATFAGRNNVISWPYNSLDVTFAGNASLGHATTIRNSGSSAQIYFDGASTADRWRVGTSGDATDDFIVYNTAAGLARLIIDDTTGNVSATSFGGITEANLLDKSVNETISGIYTFTAAPVLSMNTPAFFFEENDAPLNEKRWRLRAVGGQFQFASQTDDTASVSTFLTIDRTGTTIDTINIQNVTTLSAGGTDADFDAITATSYGGIAETNLVNKTATETISGDWTYSGISIQSGNYLRMNDNVEFYLGSSNDFLSRFDGTNVEWISNVGTFDINVTDIDLNMQDNRIIRAELDDYSITSQSQTPTGTTVTCTYSTAQAHEINLGSATGTVTITISGGPPSGDFGEMIIKVLQDFDSPKTLAWAGGTFVWAGGAAIPPNQDSLAITIYYLNTWDAGTTWYINAQEFG